jgi:hypothetical protein
MTITKVAQKTTEPTKPVKSVRPVKHAGPTDVVEPKPRPIWRPILGDAVDAALHAYEQLVANFVAFEHKAAESVRSEQAKAALNLHAKFVEDLNAVYLRTARAAMR